MQFGFYLTSFLFAVVNGRCRMGGREVGLRGSWLGASEYMCFCLVSAVDATHTENENEEL